MLFFQQYYLACLSHASYLVGDTASGRAVVVDPQRDVAGYLADAERAGLRIERVIETHFHADFLSGHLELAAATGATICYGPGAEADFPLEHLADGQVIELGDVRLEVRHTPGHTPESISVVVWERPGDAVPYGVLTGDTLFIGDVGRPDLLAAAGLTAEEMARSLYRSLHTRLLTLPDATRVFPAHGAGSACGKQLSTATVSTIGEQRRTNYALQPMSEDDFVRIVTEGQPVAPLYFPFSAHRNRERHPLLDEADPPPALGLDAVLARQRAGARLLDTRDPAAFAAGHLPGSVNVGLDGRFAEYAGDVLDPSDEIVLVCDPGRELEAKVRLGRIGFDNVTGYLAEPQRAFLERPDLMVPSSRVTAPELAALLEGPEPPAVLDVRDPAEVAAGSIPGAVAIPLARLAERLGELDPARPVVAYCASGFRSAIAASLLAARGFVDASDLLGGYEAWTALVAAGTR